MDDTGNLDRFSVRRDRTGWTVFEVWTGEPAVIALVPQTGLSEDDAKHTAALFNRRAKGGDRALPQ